VKIDQRMRVTTDTYPGKAYEGCILFLASQGEFTPKNVQTEKERVKPVYWVKVGIPNPTMELKPAMVQNEEVSMTTQRPHPDTERPMDAPLLTFDLPALLAQIKREEAWQKGTRNGMTLIKGQGLRVMLVAVRAGTTIQSHQADSPISLQVIEGVLKFNTDRQTLTLRQGQLLTLQTGIPHAVEAVEESAFVLTLATETPHPVEP
jgi:quercetin dioxygenase-like cupin family protein